LIFWKFFRLRCFSCPFYSSRGDDCIWLEAVAFFPPIFFIFTRGLSQLLTSGSRNLSSPFFHTTVFFPPSAGDRIEHPFLGKEAAHFTLHFVADRFPIPGRGPLAPDLTVFLFLPNGYKPPSPPLMPLLHHQMLDAGVPSGQQSAFGPTLLSPVSTFVSSRPSCIAFLRS